jgi:multiple sugar transport system ATP-binding protein
MSKLELTNVTKVYDDAQGTETAVDSLSLSVADGEFLTLVGPSGCGKSTTLRMIAGLETVTEGTIAIDGREVQDLIPSERDIAMVFQSFALYTTMTARENIEYGLKHSTDLSRAARRERVEEMAELLGIETNLDDTPGELSGGQKQRVALGRALVREPDVFLLDEPLSNLDAKLRSEMRTELQRIHDRLGVTTVYVTHDQKEALTMADRIAVMDDGVLQQAAPPETAYDRPENRFVGTFLGSPSMNLFEVAVTRAEDGRRLVADDGRKLASAPQGLTADPPDRLTAGVRPEDIALRRDNASPYTVSVAEFQGTDNYVHVSRGDGEITARVPVDRTFERGEPVRLDFDAADAYLFDATTGETLVTRSGSSRTHPAPVDRS